MSKFKPYTVCTYIKSYFKTVTKIYKIILTGYKKLMLIGQMSIKL